jgi:ABC-type lipoprotein export system ATPase subunit
MDNLQRIAHDEGKCVILVTHSASVTEYADVVMEMRAVMTVTENPATSNLITGHSLKPKG